jgi:hypothetical protein
MAKSQNACHALRYITRVLIVAEMDTRNAAFISLAEALGFEWVGTTLDTDRFKESVSTVTSCGSTKILRQREGGQTSMQRAPRWCVLRSLHPASCIRHLWRDLVEAVVTVRAWGRSLHLVAPHKDALEQDSNKNCDAHSTRP